MSARRAVSRQRSAVSLRNEEALTRPHPFLPLNEAAARRWVGVAVEVAQEKWIAEQSMKGERGHEQREGMKGQRREGMKGERREGMKGERREGMKGERA